MQVIGLAVVIAVCACGSKGAPAAKRPDAPPPTTSWIERSDANAKLLLALEVEFNPERASELGVEEADERTFDLYPGARARRVAGLQKALAELRRRRAVETDPLVSGDLDILVREADLQIRDIELNERLRVAFFDVARTVFTGVHALLDEQAAPARRARVVERLKRYTGQLPGTRPITELARADIEEHLARGLLSPTRMEVEKTLATMATSREGVDKLFAKYQISGGDEALALFKTQLAAYEEFVRTTVLPRARADFALPPQVYALKLERVGIDLAPDKLVALAHEQFDSIQAEMQKVAAEVAKARGLPSADYRDVLRELKKEQLVGDAILPHYRQRLAEIEAIIRREHLVTLPTRPGRIRLATAAESARTPSPYMEPPRLIGNTGEQGSFVLPLTVLAPTGSKEGAKAYDDFTYAAASWTLTAHESRPGHELQFASMVERGLSLARKRYAFNSVNAEGWALYSEAIILPFMPPEGRLVSLDYRLLRAARAFLDPELQQGKWTFESARAFLEKEVVASPALSAEEVERYTFQWTGQAPSYLYGYTRLVSLRREVEQRLGPKFDAQVFHDTILAEGLLPPDLMRAAVLRKLGL